MEENMRVDIKDETYEALSEYCEISGASINDLLDEASDIYIEASLSVDIEQIAEKTASA
jgi:hypothetical protein